MPADVFFVISGFLITSIIVKEISRGDFSLAVSRTPHQGVPSRLPDEAHKLAEGAKEISARSRASMEQNKRWKKGDPLCKIGVETGTPSYILTTII